MRMKKVLSLVLAVAMLAGITPVIQATEETADSLNEGLILYYDFEADDSQPAYIKDASGNGNDATIINNIQEEKTTTSDRPPSTSVTEAINNVITVKDGVAVFPGSTEVTTTRTMNFGQHSRTETYTSTALGAALKLPNSINQDVTSFTYSAWIKADGTYIYANNLTRFFDFGNLGSGSNNARNSIFARYTSSSGLLRIQDRDLGSNAYQETTISSCPFTSAWGLFTFVYEKNEETGYYETKVYVNGEEIEELSTTNVYTRALSDLGELTDASNGFFIGRTVWAATNQNVTENPDFKGEMDEIRLYNRALTAEEVRELYYTKNASGNEIYVEKTISVAEDVELSGKSPDTNMNGETTIMLSSTDSENGEKAGYTRYYLVRPEELTTEELAFAENSKKTLLNVYVQKIDNKGTPSYYCYGLSGEEADWDVSTVTFNNYAEQLGGSISNDGISEVGELLDTQTLSTPVTTGFWMSWDVTDFLKEHAGEEVSFLLTSNTCCAYINAAESGSNAPYISVGLESHPIFVVRYDEEGNTISTSTAYAAFGDTYTYSLNDALISYNGQLYIADEESSDLTVDFVTGGEEVSVVYKVAESANAENVEAVTYVGKAPSLPEEVTVTSGLYKAQMTVLWDNIEPANYAQKGEFETTGVIKGTEIPVKAKVTVFPEYNGQVGGDLTLYIYADGELREEKRVNKSFGSSFTLNSSYENYLGNLYELDRIEGDITQIGQSIVMNSLNQHVELYFVMKEAVEGSLSVKIKADDYEATSHTLTATAKVLNARKTDETIKIIIADYNDNGELTNAVAESVVAESRTGETVTITKSIAYDETVHKNSVVFLWTDDMEPVTEAVYIKDVPVREFGYMEKDAYEMMPTYDSAVTAVRSANDYWQSNYSYNTWTNSIHPSFWARAAYHTGNMEVYKLLGDDDYLQYSIDWANYNNWVGNPSTADPSTWTWGYNQEYNSNAVLFGDWQICFQSYIDMYNFGVADANLDRVYEVIDYQISKENDDFWWWADALYMVMPVMTKLYKLTENEAYLDALTKYFTFAKELMYDGPGGIPTSADGYTSTAYTYKNSGSNYSDPDDYKYLFFRDAGYVYPLNPNSGHESEKNFWARGNGWVFAGLAKVLSDMPATYANYDVFYNTYMEMAPAIIACQETDDNGYGFWTQSMLQNYPTGNNGNDEGYETSGTAFFTYGLFWGINNGFLDEDTYLEATVRSWGYLEKVALHSNGKVGYVQPIGSNATHATPYDTTQDFGVGAYLLAGCEAARWAENQ